MLFWALLVRYCSAEKILAKAEQKRPLTNSLLIFCLFAGLIDNCCITCHTCVYVFNALIYCPLLLNDALILLLRQTVAVITLHLHFCCQGWNWGKMAVCPFPPFPFPPGSPPPCLAGD